ncbi:DUF58 domain-containing protein [Rubrivirga sp. S365]|uniref:DUF58 domain-containing protein n=1 Tax=Rubrivirga litoralis TaxID=3075598 RepID=A0ABU3BMA8_9BACT|nr:MULTISPECIES: DUF58 domain-containing protein [unclassified Rubrivirga]MDT0630416.1 DUF58 domain-containing protein [Rubrivirga sp. F394]MDT7857605.1 DUF58 domain-containing protein [Rubrivirga sp. S365]
MWAPLLPVAVVAVSAFGVLVLADALLLWRTPGGGLDGARALDDKLSLGDQNEVRLVVRSGYPFAARVRVLDEVPVQFQKRDAGAVVPVEARGEARLTYTLRPTARGEYAFGTLNLFAATPLGLVLRRFRTAAAETVAVYPSILQMQRYAFLAASDRLEEVGVKRVRRLGQTLEFDQVREYVAGDDRRLVNWKATARRSTGGAGTGGVARLMVNQYQEERAQPVVAALDMGRAMRSPFDGLTLLDHSVNAALVLLNTALGKDDQAGLVAFDREVRVVVPAGRRRGQLPALLDALYRLDPGFTDPSFEALYAALRGRLRQRSLVLLFTNVDTRAGLERRLPVLRRIARLHRLVVVLFENTGIRGLLDDRAERLEDVYTKAVAEGLALEKREVARTLERHGIGALLTSPESLTVDAVNRYIQIKARGAF